MTTLIDVRDDTVDIEAIERNISSSTPMTVILEEDLSITITKVSD